MVCGSTHMSLAVVLVPSLVVPIVVANLIGLGVWRVHKHHKRQRAAAREDAAEAAAAGGPIAGAGAGGAATGEAVMTATLPSGDSTSTVVSAGQSAAVPANPSVTIVGSTKAGTKTSLKKIRKSDGSDMSTSEITGQHITINGEDPDFTYVVVVYEEPARL